ncbi:hypothetical protein TL16_g00723 [Triparma laevis f. inornata]|uniref:Uncharacterized protein n=1 Tax=Triparma laevis f. inornata TaxID=1714386 RepID=A0A9W6ZH29_9STRA|nr:hypothetical protein TL16_g00723 [Triparma laevis f. inornata]
MNYNGGVPPAQAPGRQFSDQTNPGNPNAQYQSPIGGGFGGNSGPEFDLTADFPSLGGGGSGKQPVAYARMAALPPKQNLNPQFSIQNEEFPALGGGGPGGSGPAPGQQPQGLGNGGQVYQQRSQGGGNFGNPGGPPNQSIGGQQHNNPQQQQSSGQNNQNPLGFSNQPPQNTVSNPGQLGNPHQGPGPGQIGGNQHHSNLGGLNQNQNSNVMNGGIGIAGGNTSSAIGGGSNNNSNNNMGNPTNNTNIGGGQPLGGTPQGGFGPQGSGGGSAPSSSGGGGAGDGAAISGDYGLLGLLSVIRMSDPDKNTLSLGSDLTSLGLNLNSSESLYNNFASPWADKPTTREPQYQVRTLACISRATSKTTSYKLTN